MRGESGIGVLKSGTIMACDESTYHGGNQMG
jgi:hypothetical protein